MLVLAALPAAGQVAGKRVTDVLADIGRGGVRLIFSDDLVPPTLRVGGEPAAKGGIDLAREILAPYGLTLQPAGAGVWAVVAAPRPPPPVAALPVPIAEVVVSASLYSLADDRLQPHTFLTAAEAASLPKLADETLRAVHRLPGAASNGVSGLAHMRGGEENETQVVLDGLPLPEPFHLKNFFAPVSVLDAAIIDSVDAYAGAYPSRWGERLSSVLDVRSVIVPDDGIYQLGLSLFHASALAADDLAGGRVRWLVSGRRSNLDEVSDLLDSNLGEPRYVDTFGRVEVDVGDRLTVGLRGLLSSDAVELRNEPVTEEADARYRNAYGWLSADYRFSDTLRGSAIAGLIDVRNDRDGVVTAPDRSGFVDDFREYRMRLARLGLAWDDGVRSLSGGVEAARLDATYRYQGAMQFAADAPFPGLPARGFTRDFVLDPDGSQVAAWIATRFRFGERLTAEAGLRWADQTYDDVDGRRQFGPRLALLYALTGGTRVRLGWGRFFQPQAINELQVEDGVPTFFAPQRADHLVAGVEHAFGGGLELRVEAYRKEYDALRPRFENLFDPFSILPELQSDRIRVAPDEAYAQGVEAILRRRGEGAVDWWLSYAWSQARDELDGRDVPRSWEQRHSLNAGTVYRAGRWNLSLAGTWHSGWPTTTAVLVPGPEPTVTVGPRNAVTFSDFLSVDLRIGYTAALGRSELETYLELTNAIGHRNACCADFAVVDGAGGPELQRDLDYWPRFLPNLGVRWRF